MEKLSAAVDGEDDDFLDQQPDQGEDDFMSDAADFLHQQTGQGDHDDDDNYWSDDDYCDDDDDEDFRSAQGDQQTGQGDDDNDDHDDYWSDDDDDLRSDQGNHDNDDFMSDDEEEEYPFPVHAPPATTSEAAIAALEATEAPADDCCPVCLQDDGGEVAPAARPWKRVAPCGHRFHAACVDKWLRVKLSCPVGRCPAAAPPAAPDAAAAAPMFPDIVEEFLAMDYEESLVFERSTRWMEYMDDPRRHIAWNSSWVAA